jgi:hypothetical protein
MPTKQQEELREQECFQRLATQFAEYRQWKDAHLEIEQQAWKHWQEERERRAAVGMVYQSYLQELLLECGEHPEPHQVERARFHAQLAADLTDWYHFRRKPGPPRPVRLERMPTAFSNALLNASESSGRLPAVRRDPVTPIPEALYDEQTKLLPATRAELEKDRFLL